MPSSPGADVPVAGADVVPHAARLEMRAIQSSVCGSALRNACRAVWVDAPLARVCRDAILGHVVTK